MKCFLCRYLNNKIWFVAFENSGRNNEEYFIARNPFLKTKQSAIGDPRFGDDEMFELRTGLRSFMEPPNSVGGNYDSIWESPAWETFARALINW